MEKEMIGGKNSGKAFVVFLVGSALAAGAAFLLSKVCKKGSKEAAEGETSGTYCAVPEGADIRYPK